MARANAITTYDDLRAHLNRTKSKHNGFAFASFSSMLNVSKRPSTASMAKIFNVSSPTMHKWIKVFDTRQKPHKQV